MFYASSADEPTNFLNGTSRRTIGRKVYRHTGYALQRCEIYSKIVVTVFDNGHPSASSSAVSHVDVVNVNDNSPQIVFRGEGNCISEMTSRRRRRRGTEEKGKMVIHDEEKMEIYHEETLGRKKMVRIARQFSNVLYFFFVTAESQCYFDSSQRNVKRQTEPRSNDFREIFSRNKHAANTDAIQSATNCHIFP